MQQQTLSQSLSSHSSVKIKPIITPYCREKIIKNLTALRSSKPHVKNLKKMKFHYYDTRFAPWNRSLRAFVSTLKSQNSLSKLHYQLLSQFQFNTALFSKELRGLSSLSSLKLEVREESRNATYVQTFMKTLASFKNLTHLDVQFSFYKVKRSPAIENFFKNLVQLRKLTSLSLNISLGQNAKGGELDLLSSSLCKLTKLRSLKLNVDKSIETDDKNLITILPSVLAKLTNLTHLELNPSGRTIQASALLKLFFFFGTMKTLSSIKTNLTWSHIDTGCPTDILSDCLSCLDASSILQLNLYISSASLNKLPQDLKRFPSLSALRLNFRHCNVMTDENVIEISSMLSGLAGLESLNLAFPPLETDILVESIVNVLIVLQNLKFLELAFDQLRGISGKQVKQLFWSLKPSLQFLNIDIHEPKTVVLEDSYEKLGENLKKLIHLKNLSLNFGRNNVIKNAEIESIVDAIKGLQSLSSLELRIGGLEDIDERAFEKIAEAVRVLPSLSSVEFHLNQRRKLKDKEDGLLSLFSALKEKTNIIDISLWISHSQTNQEQTSELGKVKDLNLVWC